MLLVKIRDSVERYLRLVVSALLADVLVDLLTDRGFKLCDVYAWPGTPDYVAKRLRIDVREIATALEEYDGVTITLTGTLGPAELSADIDVYAHSKVPVEMSATREEADVLVDVVGRAGPFSINNFRQLLELTVFAEDLLRDLLHELNTTRIRTDINTYKLARLVEYIMIPPDIYII